MTTLFAGILMPGWATMINAGAKMWVVNPSEQNIQNIIPLTD